VSDQIVWFPVESYQSLSYGNLSALLQENLKISIYFFLCTFRGVWGTLPPPLLKTQQQPNNKFTTLMPTEQQQQETTEDFVNIVQVQTEEKHQLIK